MTRPLVTVFTATYEGEAFVAETIESVLAQTYPRIEHVLVDDSSMDATPKLLAEYQRRYPERIRVIRAGERLGPCRRRNDGLKAARGSLLAWLDHDDVWLPRKIERQVDALDTDPLAALSYTQFEEFDHQTSNTLARSKMPAGDDLLEQLFVKGCFIASSTVLFRRADFERHGGRLRESEFSFGDDYTLWLSLLTDRSGVLVDEVLVRLRRHDRNESARLGRENYERRVLPLLDEFVDSYPERTAALGWTRRRGYARHWAAAAEWELTRGSRGRTAAYATRAALLDPVGAANYVGSRVRRRLRRR